MKQRWCSNWRISCSWCPFLSTRILDHQDLLLLWWWGHVDITGIRRKLEKPRRILSIFWPFLHLFVPIKDSLVPQLYCSKIEVCVVFPGKHMSIVASFPLSPSESSFLPWCSFLSCYTTMLLSCFFSSGFLNHHTAPLPIIKEKVAAKKRGRERKVKEKYRVRSRRRREQADKRSVKGEEGERGCEGEKYWEDKVQIRNSKAWEKTMTKEKDRRRDWIPCSRAERWRREEESMKRKQEGREGRMRGNVCCWGTGHK